MNISPLRIISSIVLCVSLFLGWRFYLYFVASHQPSIVIRDFTDQAYVSQNLSCIVQASDAYGLASMIIELDGTIIEQKSALNKKNFEYPLSIDTKTMLAGKHSLSITAKNKLYYPASTTARYSFFVDNVPLQAALIRVAHDGTVLQGRTLHLQMHVNKTIKNITITALGQTYCAYKEAKNSLVYEAFIPIDCEEIASHHLARIEIQDNVDNSVFLEAKFQIMPANFKKQNLTTLDQDKLLQEKELGKSEQCLEDQVAQCTKNSVHEKLWLGSFYPPLDIVSITTEYGTIRTTQERGRYMHKAVDVTNKPKSVLWATHDGIVVIKDRFVHSGNTIVLDHGCGVLSLFYHLDECADVEVGTMLKRGKPLGTLGKTGYAKGYHLHWEMRINNQPVDPLQWITPNF